MVLKDIVPWGRTRAEYIKMFKLTKEELRGSILGCGDGPSSFNSENGGNVISFDPIYNFSRKQIEQRIKETSEVVCKALEDNYDEFIWTEFSSVTDLKEARLGAMNKFLEDYDKGKEEGRYIAGALPKTDFSTSQFNLVLSSHFLFLYSDQLTEEFHINSIKEMLRVGESVKIFPLCNLRGERSSHLSGVISWLQTEGYEAEIVKTEYEFQRGGNEFLYIRK